MFWIQDIYLFGGTITNPDGVVSSTNEIHKFSIGEMRIETETEVLLPRTSFFLVEVCSEWTDTNAVTLFLFHQQRWNGKYRCMSASLPPDVTDTRLSSSTVMYVCVLMLVLHTVPFKCLDQGSSNSILEGLCPAEFSSNLPQHTCLEVSSIPSKTLISCFRCVWLGLELNSAGTPALQDRTWWPLV